MLLVKMILEEHQRSLKLENKNINLCISMLGNITNQLFNLYKDNKGISTEIQILKITKTNK